VAFAYGGVFVQQLGMLQDDFASGVHIVAPDGVDQAAREHELRVGELGDGWRDLFGMVTVKIRDRRRIATADGAEQVLRLVL
jgi:hypothetical protein